MAKTSAFGGSLASASSSTRYSASLPPLIAKYSPASFVFLFALAAGEFFSWRESPALSFLCACANTHCGGRTSCNAPLLPSLLLSSFAVVRNYLDCFLCSNTPCNLSSADFTCHVSRGRETTPCHEQQHATSTRASDRAMIVTKRLLVASGGIVPTLLQSPGSAASLQNRQSLSNISVRYLSKRRGLHDTGSKSGKKGPRHYGHPLPLGPELSPSDTNTSPLSPAALIEIYNRKRESLTGR